MQCAFVAIIDFDTFCAEEPKEIEHRSFSFVIPYRGQREVFLKSVNFTLENISKWHSLSSLMRKVK
jgi:hypothetical protein